MNKCTCIGKANKKMTSICKVHDQSYYVCEYTYMNGTKCTCEDYVPRRDFIGATATNWPVCKCGHMAEEHN